MKNHLSEIPFYVQNNSCAKNLLRFLNNKIAGGRINKRLNYLQGILFLGLLKIKIILYMKCNKRYLACFFLLTSFLILYTI